MKDRKFVYVLDNYGIWTIYYEKNKNKKTVYDIETINPIFRVSRISTDN